MNKYQFQIQEAIEALDEIEDILFTRMINLAAEGELKEISDTFKIDEIVPFRFEDLKNIHDPNVKLLMNIFNEITLIKEKFENLYPNNDNN